MWFDFEPERDPRSTPPTERLLPYRVRSRSRPSSKKTARATKRRTVLCWYRASQLHYDIVAVAGRVRTAAWYMYLSPESSIL
eukprot:6515324-Prymnesium_polylepis.1